MEELLQKVKSILQEEKVLKEERLRRGEFFNIFEVMRAEDDEASTHSALLAELLNPEGKHGCGDSFYRLFVDNVIEPHVKSYVDVKSVGKIRAYSEYFIGNGRLDILLEDSNNKAVIIENKIYAGDQEGQLYRYKKFADGKYGKGNYLILYLTLDGHSPDSISITGNGMTMEEGKDFFRISYENLLPWISLCKEKATDVPTVRETLTQYYNLIAKLTYQDMEQTTKEKMVELFATKENVAALFKIKDVHEEVLNKICNTELKRQVEEIAEELSLEYEWFCRSWHVHDSHFFFRKASWKHFHIAFEFIKDGFRHMIYGIWHDDAKDKEIPQQHLVREKLRERMKEGKSSSWFDWYKDFDYKDWNDAGTFEKLYDGSIKKAIKEKVEELLAQTSDLDM